LRLTVTTTNIHIQGKYYYILSTNHRINYDEFVTQHYNRASDDNLLKNIELFDKLAEKHRERGLFIKDVIGSNEICCWTFYGPGGAVKKVAEVCCTSIVYATDKKHTKVRLILILTFTHISNAHKTYKNLWILL